MKKTNHQEYIVDKGMKVVAVRVSLKEHKKLILLAKSNERTLSGQVRFMVKQSMVKQGL